MKNKSFIKILLVSILSTLSILTLSNKYSYVKAEETGNRTYLSDLNPIYKSIGYGSMHIDTNMSNDLISYIVDSKRTYFYKGITAHATSTLIYDIGENHNFDYFSSYLGVDASQNGAGEVKFSVYTSLNNVDYTTILEPTIRTSSNDAIYLKIDISNIRYIKFIFDSNGGNGNDHSGLGNPILYSSNYEHEPDVLIKTVEYYNNLLKDKTNEELLENYQLEVLQRALIEKCDYDTLKERFLVGEKESDRRQMLSWLYNDLDALKEFIVGGDPDGTYIDALDVLTDLYIKYKDDFNDQTNLYSPETNSTRKRGDLYKTVCFAIALTHASGLPHSWLSNSYNSDPIERYEAFKYAYNQNVLRNDIYENLNVEEMRWVMGNRIYNDEIYWLNRYVTLMSPSYSYPTIYSPHRFLKYGKDWDYTAKGYKQEENFATYDEKYHLTEYGLNFTDTYNKLWMVFEGSHICWGISYTGSNFAAAFGVPSHYCRQDGHAAFFVYNKDSSNRTTWSIDNNISGWTSTWLAEDVVGYSQNRMLCDFGSKGNGWSSSMNATYLVLASTCLDNYDDYADVEVLLTLKSLREIQGSQEELYRDCLDIMPYHLDAWEKLCKYYSDNKSASEISTLSNKLCNDMYYFPLPMHDLLNILKASNNLKASNVDLGLVNTLEYQALNKGLDANNDNSAKTLLAQIDICRVEANYLLGNSSSKIASFSFDGDNKNCIVIDDTYDGVRYRYSIDGGNNWSSMLSTTDNGLIKELSNEEINNLNEDNDILIWLEGWPSDDSNPNKDLAFKIDLNKGSNVTNINANDNENKFFGDLTNLEYSLDSINYYDLTTDTLFNGSNTVYVRRKASGLNLSSDVSTFTFTENNSTNRVYISKDNLEIVDFSSEETSRSYDQAIHVIDGNINTRWHTNWQSNSDNDRYITIDIGNNVYLSGLNYTPVGGNGTVTSYEIYVSLDNQNWYLVNKGSWNNNTDVKYATFEPTLARYVKFKGVSAVNGFCSAKLIELFEDKTFENKEINDLYLLQPTKTQYFLNQSLDTSDLKAYLYFEDTSKVLIPNNVLEISGFDSSYEGIKTINVSYLTYTKSFNVTVNTLEDCVAAIGIVGYDSLNEALSNATSEDIIYLMKDIIIDSSITISKAINIDGNNHTITRSTNLKNSPLFILSNGSNVILDNVIISGGTNWIGEEHLQLHRPTISENNFTVTSSIIGLQGNAKLTLQDGAILKNNYNLYEGSANSINTGGAITMLNQSILVINGATIQDCYTYEFGSAIYHRDYTELIINDCLIKGCSGSSKWNTTAICCDNNSTCSVNGGTFKYNVGNSKGGVFWISKGTLNINGGNFKDNVATLGSSLYVNETSNINITNFDNIEEIYLTNNRIINIKSNLENLVLNINSATSTDGTKIAIIDNELNSSSIRKSINYINKYIEINNNQAYIWDKETIKAKSKLTNLVKDTYYLTFEEAYNDASTGDTITLLDNIELTSDFLIDKAITINCDAYAFSGHNLKNASGCDMVIDEGNIIFSTHIHNFSTPTYIWNEDHSSCHGSRCCKCGLCEEDDATIEISTLQYQSCTSDEIFEYKAIFFAQAFQTQTYLISGIEASHNFEHVNYVSPTCIQEGILEHDHCTICSKDYINGLEVSDVTIDKIIHQETHYSTREEDGKIITHCDDCNCDIKIEDKIIDDEDNNNNNLLIILIICSSSILILGIIIFILIKKKKIKVK